jgi:hypothetical protein
VSDTERTQHMTDAEVLEHLRATRKPRPPIGTGRDWTPGPKPPTSVGMLVVYLFALLGMVVAFGFILNLHSG